jgi:uncharacterized protein (TIGR00299 family) protein
MARILYFDCFSGASGDMILGALLDAGLPLEQLRAAVGSLALDGVTLEAERVDRSGIGATKFRVRGAARDRGHDHDGGQHQHGPHHHDPHHHHHEHGHRGLSEICALVDRSALSGSAKDRARRLFRRLAETEADIHQRPVEEIHLHEVGAVDSIIDIAGAVFGLEWVAADRIVSSPLNVGSGTVTCAHGVLPVPAPATARLVAGVPVYSTGVEAELLTPTGALLVTDYASQYGPLPALRVRRVGYGAGDRDLPGSPNVVRVVIGDDADADAGGRLQRIVVIESEIDDMNPQIFGVLMDRLHAAGALDVFYAPIQMKKNRPATLVSVVALPEDREALTALLFRETTTIGVRFKEMDRERLDRDQVTVETPLGPVRFKVARRDGDVVNAAPEFDDCLQLAERHHLSVKAVQAIATKAYLDR